MTAARLGFIIGALSVPRRDTGYLRCTDPRPPPPPPPPPPPLPTPAPAPHVPRQSQPYREVRGLQRALVAEDRGRAERPAGEALEVQRAVHLASARARR